MYSFDADAVSQKHFESIKSSIHFVDNSKIDPMDNAAKTRPVIDQLNKICKLIDLDQHCSVVGNNIPYKRKKEFDTV